MCSKVNIPGHQALETARALNEMDVFKKPIGFAKKSKLKVLEEDSYIDKMGKIIERDFYPDLEKLRAQNDYLEAVEQNDTKRMRELYAKYSSGRIVQERIASPATFETPIHKEPTEVEKEQETETKAPGESKKEPEEKKLSLDQYLLKNTSEDNASFQEMMIQDERKHRMKYAWLYEAEEKSKQIKGSKLQKSIEYSEEKTKELQTWGYNNKNYIMYIPDGVELTNEEKIELAKKRQEVVHENTRLKVNPFNEQQNQETINELAKTQSKANDGKIGVDGKEMAPYQTPRINGYSFVVTPSPSRSECETPLMTWGEIEGTPFRLDGADTPLLRSTQGPSFRMAEPPKREQLAMQLAEKVGEKHRERKNKALEAARRSLSSPSPRSAIDRLNTMSPAARRLATQKLRISITPSPGRTTLRTPHIGVKTPRTPSRAGTPRNGNSSLSTSSEISKSSSTEQPVLTDNLLNLPPKRQRASDFF